MKTISGREIKVSPNHSRKTFTIRTESGKYRTLPMNSQDFNSCLHNSGQDWQEFLKTDEYYKVK